MLQDIQSVGGSKITCICVNNPEVKKRVLVHLGDIQIPALVVKDVEGNVDTLTGKKLQNWIRGLVEYSRNMSQPEPTQDLSMDLSTTEQTSLEDFDEGPPTMRKGEDAKSFQQRINEYYKNKNDREREAKNSNHKIDVGAIMSKAQASLEDE